MEKVELMGGISLVGVFRSEFASACRVAATKTRTRRTSSTPSSRSSPSPRSRDCRPRTRRSPKTEPVGVVWHLCNTRCCGFNPMSCLDSYFVRLFNLKIRHFFGSPSLSYSRTMQESLALHWAIKLVASKLPLNWLRYHDNVSQL